MATLIAILHIIINRRKKYCVFWRILDYFENFIDQNVTRYSNLLLNLKIIHKNVLTMS